MDKERILNFTSMLDKLGENETCDKFMEFIESSKNPSMITKVSKMDKSLSKKISKIGIPSLHDEYNNITAGWVDKLRDNWNKMRGKSPEPSADEFIDSQEIAPSQLWSGTKKILNEGMSDSLFEISQLGKELSTEWESVKVEYDILRQKVNNVVEAYRNIKNNALSEVPEQYRKSISDTYFSSLDSKVGGLNKVVMEEMPSSEILNYVNNFSKEFSNLIGSSVGNQGIAVEDEGAQYSKPISSRPTPVEERSSRPAVRPTVKNEDDFYSLTASERDYIHDAFEEYNTLDFEGKRDYLRKFRSSDPRLSRYLSNWIRNYG